MPDIVLYHSDGAADDLNTRGGLEQKLLEGASVVMLSADESPQAVTKAFENGVRGYIPTTSTPIELAIEIIRLVRAGGMFVPLSSLARKSVNRNRPTPPVEADHHFTPRQLEVLAQLILGKANKMIAYELKMSESTVKVHIRSIMKKMDASNRTEVACRARDLFGMADTPAETRSMLPERPIDAGFGG
jgi:DNA-binding NarL/FixJ family response regulator